MNKVYIVTSGEYSDYHIDAVFTTREKVVYAFHVDPSLKPSVEEVYIIDKRNIETFKDRVKRWYRSDDILKDYNALGRFVFLKENNPDKAIKIVLDRVAKAKAEKEGIF